MHPLLQQALEHGYTYQRGIKGDTLEFAQSLGTVFHPLLDESPIVTMKIEGNDRTKTPYASCRTPELSLHTDYATFPSPPRFTITHCIEPDPEFPQKGVSIILIISPVIQYLRANNLKLLQLLQTPCFPFRRNAEHTMYHTRIPTFPILDENNNVRFDRTLIIPHLEELELQDSALMIEAVRSFEEACQAYAQRIEIPLDRNDVLIIDNWRVLHSRTECTVKLERGRLVSREVNLAFLL